MRRPKQISSRSSPWSFEAQVSGVPTTIQDRRRREFCCSLLPPLGFGDRQTQKSRRPVGAGGSFGWSDAVSFDQGNRKPSGPSKSKKSNRSEIAGLFNG